MTKYMHLLNGRPAVYDGNQVCFAGQQIATKDMADSWKQVKEEYRLSENWRIEQGMEPYEWQHTYIRIKIS